MASSLKEVVGAMLSSVANARMISDAQTATIAQSYQNDTLMRYFPVPRVEIKEVAFDLKVAVMEITENETMVETSTAALQDFRPETLTQIRVTAHIQNYLLQQNSENVLQLIPTQ